MADSTLRRLVLHPSLVRPKPPAAAVGGCDLHAHVGALFPGMAVKGCNQFRVTRNSDLWVDEEEVEDLLHALQGELFRRNYGSAVRLEVTTNSRAPVSEFLLEQFELSPEDLFVVDGPVNLNRLSRLYDFVDRPDLKYPPFVSRQVRVGHHADSMFDTLRHHDVLLHHPYDSYDAVVNFLCTASHDTSDPHLRLTSMAPAQHLAVQQQVDLQLHDRRRDHRRP